MAARAYEFYLMLLVKQVTYFRSRNPGPVQERNTPAKNVLKTSPQSSFVLVPILKK